VEGAHVEQKVVLLWSSLHGLLTLTMAGRFDREYALLLRDQIARDVLLAWGIQPCSASEEADTRYIPGKT
jgi:hypothetical protein